MKKITCQSWSCIHAYGKKDGKPNCPMAEQEGIEIADNAIVPTCPLYREK